MARGALTGQIAADACGWRLRRKRGRASGLARLSDRRRALIGRGQGIVVKLLTCGWRYLATAATALAGTWRELLLYLIVRFWLSTSDRPGTGRWDKIILIP